MYLENILWTILVGKWKVLPRPARQFSYRHICLSQDVPPEKCLDWHAQSPDLNSIENVSTI